MPRNWTKNNWRQYHDRKAEKEGVERYASTERAMVAELDSKVCVLEAEKYRLTSNRSMFDRLASYFSPTETALRVEAIEAEIAILKREYAPLRQGMNEAAAKGRADLNNRRAEREKLQVHRKEERRIRYLERSPAIRSAQQGIKQHLIDKQLQDMGIIRCYYCNVVLRVDEVHVDHKTPVVREGSNKRSNLVLACAPCNLKKGTKTEAEFKKYLETDKKGKGVSTLFNGTQ